MKRRIYKFEYQGQHHTIEVAQPLGVGGDVYYVNIDGYHSGQIVPSPKGLIPHVNLGTLLAGDDLGVIMDDINGVN